MSSKKQANIRPDLIGELYTDGKDYFKLVSCESEPMATFQKVAGTADMLGEAFTRPLSEFANMVLMKPVHPIEKPAEPHRPRSDKGTKRQPSIKPMALEELHLSILTPPPDSALPYFISLVTENGLGIRASQGATLEGTLRGLFPDGVIPDNLNKEDKDLMNEILALKEEVK